ncbi:glycosyltransferase family 2 protein [Ileibacterium valens]|uniref:glycosyltransferase n=1 Tax=Ileibacterium valens TaxID=1862668 RepID=UPI0035125972
METKVSINILNYNTFEKSKKCIESCLKQKGIIYRIILIDNNSTDNSFQKLKDIFGTKIDYYQTGDNLGYAGGNNIGIRYCKERGYEYSLILNSDTTLVGNRLLQKMVKTLQQNKDCAVVAPQIYNVSNNGLILNENDSLYLKLLRMLKIIPENHKISKNLITISEAHGSALLVDNEHFINVGGFPEHFFMYGEESYFAKKVIWNNYLIIYLRDSDNYVLHHHDKSEKIDHWRLYLMGRNRYLEMAENKSHAPLKWPILFSIFKAKVMFETIHNSDLWWYLLGIKRAKKLAKKKANVGSYIQDALEIKNTENWPLS